MTNSERIIDLAKKNNGYITSKQIKNTGLNTIELTRLVRENKLDKISNGYYAIPNSFVDEYYKYQLKSKDAIFSYSTALYLHDLSDRTPLYFELTVPTGYNGSLSNDKNIILHYNNKDILRLGLSYMKSPFGMDIRVYDPERCICDIIKYRNHMDKEIFSKALKKYSKMKEKDLHKLMRYAKKLNIDKKVTEYMEILL